MSIQVQILTSEVFTRTFPARDGKPATHFREQKAAILRPDDFPLPFSLSLSDDQQAYQKGIYDLCPSSFEQGKYAGSLQFARRIKLTTPAPTPASK